METCLQPGSFCVYWKIQSVRTLAIWYFTHLFNVLWSFKIGHADDHLEYVHSFIKFKYPLRRKSSSHVVNLTWIVWFWKPILLWWGTWSCSVWRRDNPETISPVWLNGKSGNIRGSFNKYVDLFHNFCSRRLITLRFGTHSWTTNSVDLK